MEFGRKSEFYDRLVANIFCTLNNCHAIEWELMLHCFGKPEQVIDLWRTEELTNVDTSVESRMMALAAEVSRRDGKPYRNVGRVFKFDYALCCAPNRTSMYGLKITYCD